MYQQIYPTVCCLLEHKCILAKQFLTDDRRRRFCCLAAVLLFRRSQPEARRLAAVSFPHKQTSRVGSRLTSPPVSLPSLSVQRNHSEPTAGGGDTRQSEEKRLGRTFCVPSRSPGEGESIRQQPRSNLARTPRRRSCNDPPRSSS